MLSDVVWCGVVARSVVVIPREAKIHFNVLDFFEHELHGVTPSGEGWKRTPTSFDGAVLKVEFGLGTSKGMGGIDMASAVDGWRAKLHGSGSGDVRSSSSPSSASTRRGRWGAVHQLAGRSTSLRCDFSGLDVQISTVGGGRCCVVGRSLNSAIISTRHTFVD